MSVSATVCAVSMKATSGCELSSHTERGFCNPLGPIISICIYSSSFSERRLSKVDTLRLAVDYIKHMGYLLDNPLHDNECQCFVKTLTNTNYGSSGE